MLKFPKANHCRSRKYLDWVKQQPSVVSGLPADDPNHMKGHGMGGSVKPSDLFTFPLTRPEHIEFHNIGWKSWEEKYGNQWEHIARTLAKYIEEHGL